MSVYPIKPFMFLLTPLGEAEAHWLWVTDSFELPVNFGCFQIETKESWWWPNNQVRLCDSISAARGNAHSSIHLSPELLETMRPHILRHKKSPFYERAKTNS